MHHPAMGLVTVLDCCILYILIQCRLLNDFALTNSRRLRDCDGYFTFTVRCLLVAVSLCLLMGLEI